MIPGKANFDFPMFGLNIHEPGAPQYFSAASMDYSKWVLSLFGFFFESRFKNLCEPCRIAAVENIMLPNPFI